MYSLGMVDDEIKAKVAWLEENNGAVVEKEWLTNAVMSDHSDVTGDDADFAVCLARSAVADRVDRYFRSVKISTDIPDPAQDPLPGFKRVQKKYVFERDGKQVIVPVDDMTDEEIDAKADEHRAMGRGHFAHADELLRYKSIRRAA